MKQNVNIKKLTPDAIIPTYGTEYSAGADLYSGMTEAVTIKPGTTEFIKTGIAMEIPAGLVGLIYARSGMACKKGVAPANKVGVIDSDYRGEIIVALYNHSDAAVTIEPGDRVAQIVLAPYITAAFNEVQELSDTVRGDSGSGKSTLIKLLLKELDPTDGTITVDGRNLARIRHKQVPKYRRNVGVVFQDFRLLKDRNVYENVAFALKVIGASTAVIKKKVPQMLSMVGLAAKYKSKPRELSGGEQQRVAIARALVNEPSMLLADEPTGNLDNNNAWEIMKLLEEINEKGTTVIVVTHNLEIVKVMKKRVITIKKGLVVSDSKDGDSDEY